MPSGLKKKTVILHATTTTKVKIDHTKRPLLTHTLPPRATLKRSPVFGWGRGSLTLPTPHSRSKQIELEELLLFKHREMNEGTKKKNKTNMIKWTSLRLTPIKFGI